MQNRLTSFVDVKMLTIIRLSCVVMYLFCLLANGGLRAQRVQTLQNDYVFATGMGTSSDWLSPILNFSNIAYGNDVSSSTLDLGFDFLFEGRVYNRFSVNTNGQFRLGTSPQDYEGNYYSYYTAPLNATNAPRNTPKIVPVGADLYGTNLSYGISGAAPNRVGVYTFSGYNNNSRYTLSFQIQLYESTGEIRIVYGQAAQNVLTRSFQVGISASATDVAVVNPQSNSVSYGTSGTAYSQWPGQYRYYSFMPVNMGCAYPYNVSVAQTALGSVSLNWDVYRGLASQVTYIVEYGPSGFARGSGRQFATSSKPVVINGLQPDINYTFYVRAVCDTFDTSDYSRGADFSYCSSNTSSCFDFTALHSPGVTCTFGSYAHYNSYTPNYQGPYAYVGVIDNGQDSYGLNYTEGSRHTVHTRIGERDSCSGYQLLKIPPGECKSVRLGCVYGQYLCQAVQYDMVVDTNVSDILVLKYACVFYNPSHPDDRQPRFVLEILDSNYNYVDFTCGSADFNSSNAATANSGWNRGLASGIYWKDWTPVGLHLAAYHGQHIKVRLASFACGQGADDHFGYAYYTLSCAKAKIHSSSCVPGTTTTLSAPSGFNYKWFSSNDTVHPFSTSQSVSVTIDTVSYYCIVSFLDNPNCNFKVTHNHRVVGDTIRENIQPVICAGASYAINGDTLSASGSYSQYMRTLGGCDSLLNINLIVLDTTRDTLHPVICAGQTFDTNRHLGYVPVNGQNYPPYTTSGVYTQYLRDSLSGCLHNLVIDLTVIDTLPDTIYRTVCAGATFDTLGQSFSIDSVYMLTIPDNTPCRRHYLVIDLTVNDTLRDTISDTICAGAALDTNYHRGFVPVSGRPYAPYTSTGVYTQYLRDTVMGCFLDFVIILSVSDTLRDTLHDTICPGAALDTNYHLGCVPVSGRPYAPYTSPGVYTQYLRDTTTGCFQNLVIVLYVLDTLRDTIHTTICAGASVDFAGYRGYVPVSGQNYPPYTLPGVYLQHLRDPVTGSFQNLVIILSVSDTLRDTISRVVCAGASFDTGGVSYYYPGSYSMLIRHSVTGCYSRIEVNLSVLDTLRDTVSRVICAGATFDTVGVRYSRTGFYSQLLHDPVSRCYKRLYIYLTVNDTMRDTVHRAICAGARYDTNGHSYTQTGFYSQLLRNAQTSCYNRLYINLTVHDTFRDVIHHEVCAGASYTHGTQSYNLQGTYLQRFRTVHGCDSIVEIHLAVNDTIRDTLNSIICSGKTLDVNGQTYSLSGWYRQKLRTPAGCDSILHINLTVSDTIRDTLYFAICAGSHVDVNGQTYSRQGWYRQDLSTVAGCDSIVHISLFVDTPYNLQAYYKMSPRRAITEEGMQMTFRDYSKGNVYDRKWIFHEIPDRYPDKEVLHNTSAYYTPHIESDSLHVTLIVTTFVGCADSLKTTYPIIKGDVWVPNAFTPDADNNRLLVVGHHNVESYEIMIFNRAGLRVFHSTNPDESWDGTYRGHACPAATYVYLINFTTKSQSTVRRMQKGAVVLVR